jgi:cullin 1
LATDSGRKLMWLWNYSRNEIRTNHLDQSYILLTSTYQMAVLVQFNQHDTLSLDELIGATGIEPEALQRILGGLVKAKLLLGGNAEGYRYNPGKFYMQIPLLKIISADFGRIETLRFQVKEGKSRSY